MSRSRHRTPQASGLAAYRPTLDRTLFVLSLLGFLVVVHLGLQQERGFDRGCLGFSAGQTVEDAFDCEAVTDSASGRFLGLSNIVWGIAFYVTVALLGAAAMALPDRTALLKRIRAGVIALGFLYALYLVYAQFFQIGALCALCLVSAAITALLFVVMLIDFTRTNPALRS